MDKPCLKVFNKKIVLRYNFKIPLTKLKKKINTVYQSWAYNSEIIDERLNPNKQNVFVKAPERGRVWKRHKTRYDSERGVLWHSSISMIWSFI